ncbi:beta-lactamase family protein [Qipengyuania sp. 6D47A]|uniref:Beta-lactamase family protein n=1 Tax=Qipengyuania qiaonensis TaxID=2867240 RepID=A0ABS7JAX3_9SPHN|nr:beta-lactamase family protein [Qipengyuania qiaonensis]
MKKEILTAFAAMGALLLWAGGSGFAQTPQLDLPVAAEPETAAAVRTSDASRNRPTGADLTKSDLDTWLDGYMPYALGDGDIAGAVVVVVKDGEILTQRGFGLANVEDRIAVDPERTLFRPGSVSKLVTWTAVMQQVEQGRINLDANVNQYLDFEIPERNGEPVTMRQLMTHTAGFEEQIKDLIGHDRDEIPPYDDLLKRWVPERIFDAGETPAYSNYGTSLAGYIVERVSGEPFNDYVERHIFDPLGMDDSTFRQPVPESMRGNLATGYDKASGEVVPYEIIGPAPAGSMTSTGADMARFMLAHLNGGEFDGSRILETDTAQQMHTSATDMIPGLDRMLLGFFETGVNGQDVIAHLGDTQGFHTSLHLFMDEGVGLYASFNSGGEEGAVNGVRINLFTEFADRYFPGEPETRRVDAKTSAQHAQMLAGNWMASRRADSTFLNLTQLLGQTSVGVDADGDLVLPPGLGLTGRPANWVEVEPFLWEDINSHQKLGAEVVDGEVTRFSLSIMSAFTVFERVPWYKDASLLMPLLYASLLVLLLTALLWPTRALVRRHYSGVLGFEGRELLGYRLSRIAALAILLMLVGWAVTITLMFGDLTNLGGAFDTIVIILQLATVVVFFGAPAVFCWYLWQVWSGGRPWTAKAWSVLLVLAGLVVLWIGLVFHMIGFGTNF